MAKLISIYFVVYFTWIILFIQTKLVLIKNRTLNFEIHLSLISYKCGDKKSIMSKFA